ncbi:MAG: hypothetical protein ACXV5R_01685 [Candidatus Angelobacter sp.]
MSSSAAAVDPGTIEEKDAIDCIRKEIAEVQARRSNLMVLKISFVTAVLGFGSIRVNDIFSIYHAFYLAPLVATFFDVLIMGEHLSVRRMGAFLRYRSPSHLEREYQSFVQDQRDVFRKYGLIGFTSLSWIASMALLRAAKGVLSKPDLAWFGIVFCAACLGGLLGEERLRRMDKVAQVLWTNSTPLTKRNARS